jgi:urocanate hydratase
MVLDGSDRARKNLNTMLYFDVNNGIARRAWARNKNALSTIQHALFKNPEIKITLPNEVDTSILKRCFQE